MNKNRVEALTDGIIAIAATIMVLELWIPSRNDWSGLLELGYIFFAYVNSFFMIYIVWSMHHDLFKNAEVITKKAFMVNGVWILFLTLVPFTTAWVGSAPDSLVPEFLYPLNLLLWSAAFHWLDHTICKDNPEAPRKRGKRLPLLLRIVMYSSYALCMFLPFVKPESSLFVIAICTAILFIGTYFNKDKPEKEED